jgi:DNA-binding NarL/FixJ family response regulator
MKQSKAEIKKINLLLADDHQMLLDLWTYILSKDGRFHIVATAINGKQALEIAKEKRPDVVLMDINMDEMDGFDAAREIRRYSPATRILAVSMYTMPAYVKKMKAIGAIGYVTKNSPADELIKAIVEVYHDRPYYCRQVQSMIETEQEISTGKKFNASSLTSREIEIIRLIENGFTSKQIADKLFLSPKTVATHRYKIFRKLRVKNASSLIAAAKKLGL